MAKAYCAVGEGRRGGGRSGFKRAPGLYLRIFRLIRAVVRHLGRCNTRPWNRKIPTERNVVKVLLVSMSLNFALLVIDVD